MSNTRSSSNPPAYYYTLGKTQKANWRRNTRKMEKNGNLSEQYPPFRSSSNINVIHIHYQSTITTIDQLIKKAKETKRYVVDTESQKGENENQGALIQIQFIHSINYSTIIIIEVKFLPDSRSMLFMKIKELCRMIFNNHNDIISWGPLFDEFRNFKHLDLVHIGKFVEYDLQFLFSNPANKPITHPEMERRDEITGYLSMIDDTSSENDDDELDFNYGSCPKRTKLNQPISLQGAIANTFNKFLDKSLTVNHWKCGLDLNLETWKTKLFSRHEYDQHIEQQQRNKMLRYAIDDCTSVAELFFHLYPENINDYQTPPETPKTTPLNRTLTYDMELSDISEDELIEFLKPKLNKKTTTSNPLNVRPNQPNSNEEQPPVQQTQGKTTLSLRLNESITPAIELIIQPTPEEVQQVISPEEQRRLKAERQRKKNEKYKWKKQNLPQFNHKIRRPIYFKYDYRKIRSQLADDNIHTSHQITINKEQGEVMIGFKSDEDLQRAKSIMKINYFSKDQFNKRWGETKTN